MRVGVVFRVGERAGPYLDALRDAGLDPVPITPDDGIASKMGDLQGLTLTGGTDVDPAVYGQERQPETEAPDHERDALELKLLDEALRRGHPVLAICRGMQLFNVAHRGGTLHQHIEGHSFRGSDKSAPVHAVRVEPGTLLETILGRGDSQVNSRHHQAVDQPGGGLVVSARSTDGVIEAVERPDLKFAVAVQWHPEDMVRGSPAQRNLFLAFASALQK